MNLIGSTNTNLPNVLFGQTGLLNGGGLQTGGGSGLGSLVSPSSPLAQDVQLFDQSFDAPALVDAFTVDDAFAPPSFADTAQRGLDLDTLVAETRAEIQQAADDAFAADNVDRSEDLNNLLTDSDFQPVEFDAAGDGTIGFVRGDLATADNVAIVVPGVAGDLLGNDLENFNDFVRDADTIIGDAAGVSGSSTAVVVYQYDTPDNFASGFVDTNADTAGAAFAGFVTDLSIPDSVNTTVIPQSFGNQVVDQALGNGLTNVDNIVQFGDPGGAGNIAGLAGSDDTQVFSAPAQFDPVNLISPFGPQSSDPRSGVTRLENGSIFHFFTDSINDSVSADNLANIVTGNPDNVTLDPPSGFEQAVGVVDSGFGALMAPIDFLQEGAEALFPDNAFVTGINNFINTGQRIISPDFLFDIGSDAVEFLGDVGESVIQGVSTGLGTLFGSDEVIVSGNDFGAAGSTFDFSADTFLNGGLSPDFGADLLTPDFGTNLFTPDLGTDTFDFGIDLLTPDFGTDLLTPDLGTDFLTPDFGADLLTPDLGTDFLTPDFGSDFGADTGTDLGTDFSTPDFGADLLTPDLGTDFLTPDFDSDFGTDLGTDFGADLGTDLGSDFGTDIGSDFGTDLGTDFGADFGTDIGTDPLTPDLGADFLTPDFGSDFGTDIGTDLGTDFGSDVGTDFLTPDFGADIGTDFGADIGTDFTTDIGTDLGTDFGADFGTDIGTDFGADFGGDFGGGFF